MLLSITKNEILYSHYLSAFEQIKKNSNKNDPKFPKIVEICKLLNESKNILDDNNQLEKISIILVQPLEKCTTKIIDIIINLFIEIIKDNLINNSLLQKISQDLITYILKYLDNNETNSNTNIKTNKKILNICELIFTNNSLFIHNNNFINIIDICIKIFYLDNDVNNINKIFNIFINKIFRNISSNKICSYDNEQYHYYNDNYTNTLNRESSKSLNTDKNEFKNNILLNRFIFYSKKYIDFLIDIIEIQSLITNNKEEKNLIENYINIIQKINNTIEQKNEKENLISYKEELESLNLEKFDIYYSLKEEENQEKKSIKYKIGKYGWCILCRKTSNNWSKILNFPICDDNICEKNFIDFISSIYAKNDYMNMLLFLSKTSMKYSPENPKNKINNLKVTEICMETITDMIKKGVSYFKNDIDIIIIIREIFKESIIKNAKSQNPKIFQISLELFFIIFYNYKYYLKEQICIFFLKIIINILESESRGFIFKNLIINNLSTLLDNTNFLVEIYTNYDYDTNSTAVYCVLINLFTKILNGLYQKPKYKNNFKNIQENNILVQKSFNFINKFTTNLNELIEQNFKKKEYINDVKYEKILNGNSNKEINDEIDKFKNILDKGIKIFNNGKNIEECIKYLQKEKIICSEESFNKIINAYINDYNNNVIKEDYSSLFSQEENIIIDSIKKYNSLKKKYIEQNKKNINFDESKNNLLFFITTSKKEKLSEIDYNSYISFEIAYFIRLNIQFLSIEKIKFYLYDENPLNSKILYHYINSFNFKNKNILDSLRILFAELPNLLNNNILEKVIQIFGEKFYEENKNQIFNIDNGYYLSFYLIELNNNLHQNDIKQKIELKNFIEKANSLIQGNHKIYENNFENWYNQILKEPFIFLKNETKKINTKFNDINNYTTKIDNNSLRKMVDFSCGNFLTIYSQTLNESIFTNNKDLFLISIQKILILAKICGILKLNQAQTEFLNTILNMINLNEKDELNENMLEVIITLMTYINDNCQYIRIGWKDILLLISKLEYYLLEPEENLVQNMKNTKPVKFTDKDIKFVLNKKSILASNISDAVCESIFIKTELFDNESIINFITDLCIVSKQELNSYFIPRLFSLYKIIEVSNFNIFRSQFIWNKIWKIITEYLIDIIISYPKENISKQALESFKIIVKKYLEKEDNLMYNFQIEIFRPFEVIYYKTSKIPERGEIIIDYIQYFVAQFWKNIHSGWKIIFRLIKHMYQKKNANISEKIKYILKIIYDNKDIILNNNEDIFDEYMEFLCFIYTDKEMKPFAFEIIIGILSKIINIEENTMNDNSKIVLKMPNSNKIYDYIKIFFYNIDDLFKINIIEYFNLLSEIINHNKKILLSEDFNIFIYIYFTYFKLNLTILLFSHYINRLLNYKETENNSNIIYSELTNDNIVGNIIKYLEQSLNYLIGDFTSNESKEYDNIFVKKEQNINKSGVIGFLREIKEEYNEGKINKYISDKINKILKMEESNYETIIKYFFEKFFVIFCKNEDLKYINYKYFYIDLIFCAQQLAIFNNNSDLIYRTIYKGFTSFNNETINNNHLKLIDNNIFILNILSNSNLNIKYEEYLYIFIKYSLDFSNYLLDFIQFFQCEFFSNYKLISKLFNKVLLIELENNFEKYKIINSNSTIVLLMKLQDIQLFILNKLNKNNYNEIKSKDDINIIINLNKVYNKYKLGNEENSLINKIYIFELENILTKFIQMFNKEELEIIYDCLTNFICSRNRNIRNGAKNILKLLMQNNLIIIKNRHIK